MNVHKEVLALLLPILPPKDKVELAPHADQTWINVPKWQALEWAGSIQYHYARVLGGTVADLTQVIDNTLELTPFGRQIAEGVNRKERT